MGCSWSRRKLSLPQTELDGMRQLSLGKTELLRVRERVTQVVAGTGLYPFLGQQRSAGSELCFDELAQRLAGRSRAGAGEEFAERDLRDWKGKQGNRAGSCMHVARESVYVPPAPDSQRMICHCLCKRDDCFGNKYRCVPFRRSLRFPGSRLLEEKRVSRLKVYRVLPHDLHLCNESCSRQSLYKLVSCNSIT